MYHVKACYFMLLQLCILYVIRGKFQGIFDSVLCPNTRSSAEDLKVCRDQLSVWLGSFHEVREFFCVKCSDS